MHGQTPLDPESTGWSSSSLLPLCHLRGGGGSPARRRSSIFLVILLGMSILSLLSLSYTSVDRGQLEIDTVNRSSPLHVLDQVIERGKGYWAWLEEIGSEDSEEFPLDEENEEELLEEEGEGVENVCSRTEVGERRSLPHFWVVELADGKKYQIHPRYPQSDKISIHCLANVLFSARLVSPSSFPQSKPTTIYPLDTPSTVTDSPGSYEIQLPERLELPANSSLELEVRLEFGNLPGARVGMLCGEETLTCEAGEISRILGEGNGIVGEKIEVLSGKTVRVNKAIPIKDSHRYTPRCQSLSPLSGYWNEEKFSPIDAADVPDNIGPLPHYTCSLTTPSSPPSFSLTSKPLWIHLVGDSNTRNLFPLLIDTFGVGRAHRYTEYSSPIRNGTLSLIAFRSLSGEFDYTNQSPVEIIITWSWWYQSPTNFEENARDLKSLVSLTLEEFTERPGMNFTLGRKGQYGGLREMAKDIRPTRTYISLGSHSAELTSLGMERSLDVLLSTSEGIGDQLSFEGTSSSTTSLRFFTTTLVASKSIPQLKFPHDDLIRNNFLINTKNQLIRDHDLSNEKVIDVEGLTRGITEDHMKDVPRVDAVHFVDDVYKEWARLIWTDLMNS